MSTYNYARFIPKIKQLLNFYGKPMSFRQEDLDDGYDDDGNLKANEPTVVIQGKGVTAAINIGKNDFVEIVGDRRVVFQPTDINERIEADMLTTLEGQIWKVNDFRPVQPANDFLLYIVQLVK